VRVFINAKEALAWLYRDMPSAFADHQWPDTHLDSTFPPVEKNAHQ
jgi:hypothetical protein